MHGLYEIIFAPEETFKKQTNPWVPFIASIILTLFVTVLFSKLSYPFLLERIQERISQLSPEEQEKALASVSLTTITVFGTVGAVINTAFKIVLLSLIYYLIFIAMGSTLRYLSVMIPVSFGAYISSIGGLFKLIIGAVTKNPYPQTSLALLYGRFSPHLAKLWHYKLLSQIDIFTLWSLFIMATGLWVIARIEKKKTFLVVFGLWGIYILIISFIPVPGIK